MNALELLMTEWKAKDLKMDAESSGGYTLALSVVATRHGVEVVPGEVRQRDPCPGEG